MSPLGPSGNERGARRMRRSMRRGWGGTHPVDGVLPSRKMRRRKAKRATVQRRVAQVAAAALLTVAWVNVMGTGLIQGIGTPTYAVMTSAATPLISTFTGTSSGNVLTVTPDPKLKGTTGVLNLGCFVEGSIPSAVTVFSQATSSDSKLKVTFSISGAIDKVLSRLQFKGTGPAVEALFVQPLATVKQLKTYSGTFQVTAGNDWEQEPLDAQITIAPKGDTKCQPVEVCTTSKSNSADNDKTQDDKAEEAEKESSQAQDQENTGCSCPTTTSSTKDRTVDQDSGKKGKDNKQGGHDNDPGS